MFIKATLRELFSPNQLVDADSADKDINNS